MFYGGFGTSFKAAKPVLIRSASLATIGMLMTAAFTGTFVHFILKLDWLQSLLIGSVIAAQEFSDRQRLSMQEIIIDKNHSWVNQSLKQITLDEGSLVIMIKRNETTVIPDGGTLILPDDTLVIAKH